VKLLIPWETVPSKQITW